jgi:hypothetical protein
VTVHKHQYLIMRHVRAQRGGRCLITHSSFSPAAAALLRLAAAALLGALLLWALR